MKRNGLLNHIFRLVWSDVLNAWIAVAENTKGRGKGKNSRHKLVAAALSLTAVAFALPEALAGPTGAQVNSGSATINQSGNTTTINQSSNNLSLNWNNFNIAPQETVNFVQPSASSIAVNHILDTNGSQILGHLDANGQVFLINPNGILFGKGAQVNVGGLVASTLNFNDANLNSATRSFSGNGVGSVINLGSISSAGGYVALFGNQVNNQGTISAQLGTVALGAGNAVTLTFSGNNLLHMQVDQSVLNSLTENGGLILADGGNVYMSAGSANSLLSSVVNNTGVVLARTVDNQNGTITLLGGMTAGTVNISGTLDASAPNGGNGGKIETSAEHVTVANGTVVTTAAALGLAGSWTLDPSDFTIAASGGDMTGATMNTALSAGNVTITTSATTASCMGIVCTTGTSGSGNINVNDNTNPVTWSANTLTLSAYNNININAPMFGSGTASLALQFGQSSTNGAGSGYNVMAPVNLPTGNHFSTQQGTSGTPINYYVINALGSYGDATTAPATPTLQGIAATANLTGNFALGSNIDASATYSNWGDGNAGFTPIGGSSTPPFSGNFDGLGHTISNLYIYAPFANNVGLFGVVIAPSVVQNVILSNATVTGNFTVGGLIGKNGGTVINNVANVTVTGNGATGGLVGANYGTVSNSYSYGNIFGYGDRTGGLVVDGHRTGGLVGVNYGTVSRSYSYGGMSSGVTNTGGLVGYNTSAGIISTSFSLMTVTGQVITGGLVGTNDGAITNSYAFNSVGVSGNSSVGGLIGVNSSTGTVTNTYAMMSVSGRSYVGGLIGQNSGTVSNSFYNTTLNPTLTGFGVSGIAGPGVPDIAGTVWGMSTTSMQSLDNFTSPTIANSNVNPNWNSTAPIWAIQTEVQNPCLAGVSVCTATVYVDVTSGSSIYSTPGQIAGSDYIFDSSATYGSSYSTVYAGSTFGVAGTPTWTGLPTSTSNVGAYNVTYVSGLTPANGYALAAGNAYSFNVTPLALTVTGQTAANKVYDGTTAAVLSNGSLVGVIASDSNSVTLNQLGSFDSPNVGNGIGITAADTISGASAGNYLVNQPQRISANITPPTQTPTQAPSPTIPAIVSIIAPLAAIPIQSALVPLKIYEPAASSEINATVPPETFLLTQGPNTYFRDLSLPTQSSTEVAAVLGARTIYKNQQFSEGVQILEANPDLANIPACTSFNELSEDKCLVVRSEEDIIADASVSEKTIASKSHAYLPSIHNKRALVIGINSYNDIHIPQLFSPIADAQALRDSLTSELGYQVTLLENPGKSTVISWLNKLTAEMVGGDSLVVYFAGHGESLPKNGSGYWIPADATVKDPQSWISNSDISRWLRQIRSRQVVLIADSCYSGTFVSNSAASTPVAKKLNAEDLLRKRSVKVMSSGSNEPVADTGKNGHSVFAWNLLSQIKQVESWTPGNSLFSALRMSVERELPQTPQYGQLAGQSANQVDDGDFLFERRN